MIATIHGLVLVIGNPARHTLVFRIVGQNDLPNAVALSSALGTMARIVGPGLGGLVVAFAGSGVAFAVYSVSYLAVVLALLAMRAGELVPSTRPTVHSGLRRSVLGTLSLIRRSRRVAIAFSAVLVLSTVSFNFDVLLPLLAGQTLDAGADVFGLIAAVFGAGALCGSLLLATVGKASLRLLLAAAGGFAFQGGAPLGGLLAGWLTSRGGTQLAFAVAGGVAVIVAAVGAAVVLAGRSAWEAAPSRSFGT